MFVEGLPALPPLVCPVLLRHGISIYSFPLFGPVHFQEASSMYVLFTF